MAEHPIATAAERCRRILVVEDDPDTRRFYTSALSEAGFTVEQAHNGFQAFDKIVEQPPDLVLTDIAVPGIDGIELCRRLRSDERTRAVPVLAITGYIDRGYVDRIRLAGADAILTKPCLAERLVEAAAQIIRPA